MTRAPASEREAAAEGEAVMAFDGAGDSAVFVWDPAKGESVRIASGEEWVRLMAYIREQGGVPNLEQIIRPGGGDPAQSGASGATSTHPTPDGVRLAAAALAAHPTPLPPLDAVTEVLTRWFPCRCSEAWTGRDRHAPECMADEVESLAESIVAALPAATPSPDAGEPPVDAERLMEAMNEAYTYEDRDNAKPTLPFVDDVAGFWTPFAAKVAALLDEAPAGGGETEAGT